MALWWFEQLKDICPNHLTGQSPQSVVTADEAPMVEGRSMLVKRLKPVLIEAVVRGYLAGSGWKEYQHSGAVCGVSLPAGLKNASRLPEPIYTPAAKAQMGEHDENITFERTAHLVGISLAQQIRDTALALYSKAAGIAASKGILIADTKFEFGLDAGGNLTLMDEVLTPDSSRYWPAANWHPGENPPSYDKQYLRDWLETAQVGGQPWLKRAPPPRLPQSVIDNTRSRYEEAFKVLTI
jgi:phosphoribosylaminoimidazole-succinocarboxamide synthase